MLLFSLDSRALTILSSYHHNADTSQHLDTVMNIAITNQKGGVGKTTTAVNLAAALAERGLQTLLLDLDSQANATANLQVPADQGSVRELIGGERPHIYATGTPNLSMIPATVDLAGAETYLAKSADAEILKRALEPLEKRFDYVIFDCPPALGQLTIAALVAADYAIVPMEAGIWEMQGLVRLMEVLERTDTKLLGILLTRYDKRLGISADTHNQLTKSELPLFNVKISERVAAKYAAIAGQSIIAHNPTSDIAQQYRLLAKEVVKYAP